MSALSYGELATLYPEAGGQYVYLRKAYGRFLAFLYGWSFFAVIQTGTIAAVGVAFAKFTGVLFPRLINDTDAIFKVTEGFKLTSQRILAILSIILLTYTNSKGAKQGKIVQNVFSSTKLVAMGLLVLLGFFFANKDVIALNFSHVWDAQSITKNSDGTYSLQTLGALGIIFGLGVSQVGTLFSSDAWNNLTFAGDEVVEPEKTIPRGLALGTLVVTILYLLLNFAYLLVLPLKGDPNGSSIFAAGIQFAKDDRVGAAVAGQIGGPAFALIMAILIMISTFGCNNGLIFSGARVYYKMAEDGLFFKSFGKLNDKGVPGNSLFWQCVWASALCLTGAYGDLLDYIMGVVILFYAFTIFAIFILRKKDPSPRIVKAPFFPYMQWVYIALAVSLVVILMIKKPQYTFPGLGIVALGIPLFYFFESRNKS
jgi:APA family basic amino acid/polyamine antiporter